MDKLAPHPLARPVAPTERRREPRARALKGGLVVFGQKDLSFDCQVRNLTHDGAKLTFASTLGVPEEFQLFLMAERRIVAVRVKWRTETEVGVELTGDWEHFEPGAKTPKPRARTFRVT